MWLGEDGYPRRWSKSWWLALLAHLSSWPVVLCVLAAALGGAWLGLAKH